jgi:hypothetical protein
MANGRDSIVWPIVLIVLGLLVLAPELSGGRNS